MSQNISVLAEPEGDNALSPRALGYVTETARGEVFDLVVRNCIESGVSNATLAKRLGKNPSQISRLLGAPGNWTVDTIAQLLFAIDGRLLTVDSCWPRQEAKANMRHATCFQDPSEFNVLVINFDRRNRLKNKVMTWTKN